MFTGIITDIGTVKQVQIRGEDKRFVINTAFDMDTVALGASIACDGVCLTVIEKQAGQFTVDVSKESLRCTHLDAWQEGTQINLERALKAGDELGGHIVSGHVDGLGIVEAIDAVSECYVVRFKVPQSLKAMIAPKGSITINGVSLTVNDVQDCYFEVNIIPHTWQYTTFQHLKAGDYVHLEVDMLARYIARYQEVAAVGVKQA